MLSLNYGYNLKCIGYGCRQYAQCCPPRPPAGKCPCKPPATSGAGNRITPPPGCIPPIPANPCAPRFPGGKDTHKKYKRIFFFVCVPLILIQALIVYSQPPHAKPECRDFPYMRRFTKRFPWREGDKKTLFHNDHANYKPGECEPPLLDCD